MRHYRDWPTSWLITPAVLLFFWLALNSMVNDSPTVDEQNHLARGLAFLYTGDPRLSLEHPPLVNALSATPLLLLPDIKLPFDHPSWNKQPPDVYWYRFAEQLLWVYNHDVIRMIFLARMPILFLTIGLSLIAFHFAWQFWGRPSAIWAFLFLLFDPNVIAHGRYSTTDIGGTTFLFLATFLVWRMWRAEQWKWDRWLLAGAGLGLAFSSKLSTLVFIPIIALLAFVFNGTETAERSNISQLKWRRFSQYLTAGISSITVVWAIFGFEWGAFQFHDSRLSFFNQWSGPMPTFWAGLEQVLTVSSEGRPSFLLGHFSSDGFWAYFPVAFLVKTPLVSLGALVVSIVILFRDRNTCNKTIFLLIPAVLFFLISMQSSLNIGYRHLLPILPFIYVLISGMASGECRAASGQRQNGSRRPFCLSRLTPFVVGLGLLLADLTIHPHYLSYFNLAAGGPENGRNILIDSNLDWGQDLIRLKQWMVKNGVDSVKLGWFGTAVPEYFGIQYEPLPGSPLHEFYSLWGDPPFDPLSPAPGIYAISASSLWELPLQDDQKYVYPWFRAREPDDQVGYSILIYRVRNE